MKKLLKRSVFILYGCLLDREYNPHFFIKQTCRTLSPAECLFHRRKPYINRRLTAPFTENLCDT